MTKNLTFGCSIFTVSALLLLSHNSIFRGTLLYLLLHYAAQSENMGMGTCIIPICRHALFSIVTI